MFIVELLFIVCDFVGLVCGCWIVCLVVVQCVYDFDYVVVLQYVFGMVVVGDDLVIDFYCYVVFGQVFGLKQVQDGGSVWKLVGFVVELDVYVVIVF